MKAGDIVCYRGTNVTNSPENNAIGIVVRHFGGFIVEVMWARSKTQYCVMSTLIILMRA